MHPDYIGASIFFGLLFSPLLLLPWLWYKLRHAAASRYGPIIAGLITLSHTHLLAGLLLQQLFWGPSRSDRLYYTLGCEVIFCILLAISALVLKPQYWLFTCSTAAITGLAWYAIYYFNHPV